MSRKNSNRGEQHTQHTFDFPGGLCYSGKMESAGLADMNGMPPAAARLEACMTLRVLPGNGFAIPGI